MNKLDRYIMRTLISMVLMVFLAMLGLRVFIAFFSEMPELSGNYGLWQAVQFMVLQMPQYMYQLFPNIALLGTLMGLGLLAQNTELVVMRSSGMSMLRIIWSVIQAAILMIVLATILGEVIAPHAASLAEHRKAEQRAGGKLLNTQGGVWMRQGDEFINVKRYVSNGTAQGITFFRFNQQQQLQALSYAESGKRINGNHWLFTNVKISHFSANKVIVEHVKQKTGQLSALLQESDKLEARDLPLQKLHQQIQTRQANGISANDFQLSFWSRVFQPLTTLVMVLLAIPFIFGPLRSVSMGLRILTGIMFGLAYYIFNRFFGPFSVVYQLPALIGASIPPIMFGLLAVFLMLRKQ